jgi:hypothetical protein
MNKKLSLMLIVSFAFTCLTEISPKRVRCASPCRRSCPAAPAREENNSDDIDDLDDDLNEEEQELEEEYNDSDEDYNNNDDQDAYTEEENDEEE